MEIKEKNFFKKVWTSIKDFEGYEELAAGKLSKAIQYIVIITAIFVITIAIIYTYKFYTILKDIESYINEDVEEISLKAGELEVKTNKDIIIENEKNIIPIIIVNTSEEVNEEEYIQKIKAYNTGILLLKEKVVIASSILDEEQEIYYSTISMANIEGKEAVLDMIGIKNLLPTYGAFLLTIFIYLFFVYFFSNLIDAAILGILGNLFARILKIRLKYKATFNISIYALTLPIILNLIYIIVNTFTGFEVQHFQWMYTSISYIYVVVAILMIKTEIMQKKIELIRLREIQKQVAREAEETEPEKEEKEEKKQEEEKEESQEKNTGEEPEGSNA